MTLTQDIVERIGSLADRLIASGATPSVAVALTDRDRLLGVVIRGDADPAASQPVRDDTLFQIGSISKSFTSICLLCQMERGLIGLDDPLVRHLPWFPLPDRTVRQLLTHTGGIVMGIDDVPTSPQTVLALADAPRVEPGRYWYSNVGYQSLGYLLEAVTGESFADTYRTLILDRAGMAASSPTITNDLRRRLAVGHVPAHDDRPWRPGDPLLAAPWLEYGSADGSVCATAGDLAAYMRLLLNRGQGVLDEASFAELTHPFVDDGEGGQYGLGLDVETVEGHTWIGHSGAMVGYRAMMRGDLDAGLGVVVLVNGHRGPAELARYALRLLLGQETQEPALDDLADPAAEVQLDADPPAEWRGRAGLYRSFSPWLPALRVATLHGAPQIVVDGEISPLLDAGDGTYRAGAEQHSPERIRFDQPLDGRTLRLWYSTAPLVRTFSG